MREKGVMEYRREGGYVFHWLSNPKIFEACLLVRQVLIEQIEQVGELARLERWT